MKKYTKPNAELVRFGNEKLNTTTSKCDCIASRWTYNEYDWEHCEYVSADFSEIGDANSLI